MIKYIYLIYGDQPGRACQLAFIVENLKALDLPYMSGLNTALMAMWVGHPHEVV